MKDIKHFRRDFYLVAGVMPQGGYWGTVGGGGGGVEGVKTIFFFEIQPDLVCELLT